MRRSYSIELERILVKDAYVAIYLDTILENLFMGRVDAMLYDHNNELCAVTLFKTMKFEKKKFVSINCDLNATCIFHLTNTTFIIKPNQHLIDLYERGNENISDHQKNKKYRTNSRCRLHRKGNC